MPKPAPSKSSLSPVERSRLYHQRFRPPGLLLKIKVSNQKINTLVKRGYLGPNELHDGRAIGQALSLISRRATDRLRLPLPVCGMSGTTSRAARR
jgi:hypothetical protein